MFLEVLKRLDDDPGMRAMREARARERGERAAEVVARYGGEEAAWADTVEEAALESACRHLREGGLGLFDVPANVRDFPDALRRAAMEALPFPDTVAGAWDEHARWERRADDLAALNPDWSPSGPTEARRRLLEDVLDRLPARTFADVQARLSWMQHVLDLGFTRDIAEDQACLDALKADVEALGSGAIPPAAAPRREGRA